MVDFSRSIHSPVISLLGICREPLCLITGLSFEVLNSRICRKRIFREVYSEEWARISTTSSDNERHCKRGNRVNRMLILNEQMDHLHRSGISLSSTLKDLFFSPQRLSCSQYLIRSWASCQSLWFWLVCIREARWA